MAPFRRFGVLTATAAILGCYGHRPVDSAQNGWQDALPDQAPPEARPLVAVLRKMQDRIFARKEAEALWDESLSYVHWIWTEGFKKKWKERLDDLPNLTLQWKDVEVAPGGELCRVGVRGIVRSLADFSQGGVAFQGVCVFRKFADGWKMRTPLPGGTVAGKGDWVEIFLSEVRHAELRVRASRDAGEMPPVWASDQEIVRMLRATMSLCERDRRFPLSDAMYFMLSNVLPLRRTVHEFLVKTFGVDFGYSEERFNPVDGSGAVWFGGWKDWVARTYPKDQFVPWP